MISSFRCPLVCQVGRFSVANLCNEAGMRQMSASGYMDGNELPNLALFNTRYRGLRRLPPVSVNVQSPTNVMEERG